MDTPPPKEPVRKKLATFALVLGCIILGVVLTALTVLLARLIPLN